MTIIQLLQTAHDNLTLRRTEKFGEAGAAMREIFGPSAFVTACIQLQFGIAMLERGYAPHDDIVEKMADLTGGDISKIPKKESE